MDKLVILLLELWRQRYKVFIPIIIAPLLALVWSMSNQQIYEATTTLNLNSGNAKSPLLRNIYSSENQSILNRIIRNKQLLKDTMLQTGMILKTTNSNEISNKIKSFNKDIKLSVNNNNIIRINYQSNNPNNIEKVLEVLSLNFIDEVLAPERFRIEQNLASLAEQVKYYSEQKYLMLELFNKEKAIIALGKVHPKNKQAQVKKLVALEFELQKLQAQISLAKSEYNKTLAKSKAFARNINNHDPNSLLWFLEAPVKTTSTDTVKQHAQYALRGLVVGILFSMLLLIISNVSNNSIRSDEDIYEQLGLKILGRIPDMGDISIRDGHLESRVRANI